MPDLAGIRVEGISVGGLETSLQVPQWRLGFDCGRAPRESIPLGTLLFTHAHMDHMGGVAYHCATRSLLRMAPPRYVVPRVDVDRVRELLDAWRRLDRSELPCEIVPLAPGEEWELRRDLLVRPFRARHVVPAQGYAIWSVRRKLRPEFHGLPGEEIARLRRDERVEVTEPLETPELAFTGDTLVEVVEEEEVVRRARVLVMEVTFLDDRVSVAEARSKGHVHLDEVIERAELFQNEAFLLTHVSSRYSAEEVVQILDRRLPPRLRGRVTPLLTGL